MESCGAIGGFLYPLSLLYGVGVGLKLAMYRTGLLKQEKVPAAIISVGNLTAGGSGKTPMAILLARFLRGKGEKVVVVSRGYKGTARGVSAVSDGEKVLLGPARAGDEPYLMARLLKGVPVVVGADRVKAALFCVKNFAARFIILDDGYQHIRLFRDLNILLVDSGAGFGNMRLLPMGPLREPLEGIKRADLVMVKGGPLSKRESAIIRRYGKPVLGFCYNPVGLIDIIKKNILSPGEFKGKKVLAVAAIARPEGFLKTLKGLGVGVASTLLYPDHHTYMPGDVDDIKKTFTSTGAQAVITTEKDGVKLEGLLKKAKGLTVYALSIEAVMEDPAALERVMAPLLEGR